MARDSLGFYVVGSSVTERTAFILVQCENNMPIPENGIYNWDFDIYGRIVASDDLVIYLFGGFIATWVNLKPDLKPAGFIVLADTTKTAIARIRRMIEVIQNEFPTVPLIVAAHKQDLPTAKSPATVRELLQIPPTIPVMPSSIHQPHTIQAILLALLRRCPNEPKFQTALQIMEEAWEETSP